MSSTGFGLDQIRGTKHNATLGVPGAFLVLTWIAVSLRVYARGFLIRSFGLDDWLMLITLAFFTLQCSSLIIVAVKIEQLQTITLPLIDELIKYTICQIAFYICTQIFLKLALGVYLLRIVIVKWQRWVLYISLGIYTAFTIAYLFVGTMYCGNPTKIIIHTLQGKCLPYHVLAPLNYLYGALNAVVDWIFAIIPALVIYRSAIRAKYYVYCVLAVGTLGSIASLVRLAWIPSLNPYDEEFFLALIPMSIISIIEPGLGIVAASCATLRPLLKLAKSGTQRGSDNTYKRHHSVNNNNDRVQPPVREQSVEVAGRARGSFARYGFQGDLESFGTTTTIRYSAGDAVSDDVPLSEKIEVTPRSSD